MSFVSVQLHFVWSTKQRVPLIDPTRADQLYGYLGGILRNNNATLLAAGGMPDHVHLYAAMPSTLAPAKAVNLLKPNATTWVKQNHPDLQQFAWQEGYGVFSVSKSGERQLRQYIANQESHHRERTYKEEFLALLDRHAIEYDERYLWD